MNSNPLIMPSYKWLQIHKFLLPKSYHEQVSIYLKYIFKVFKFSSKFSTTSVTSCQLIRRSSIRNRRISVMRIIYNITEYLYIYFNADRNFFLEFSRADNQRCKCNIHIPGTSTTYVVIYIYIYKIYPVPI